MAKATTARIASQITGDTALRELQVALNAMFVIAKWTPIVVAHCAALLVLYRIGKSAWKGAPTEGTSNAALVSAIAAFIWVLSR